MRAVLRDPAAAGSRGPRRSRLGVAGPGPSRRRDRASGSDSAGVVVGQTPPSPRDWMLGQRLLLFHAVMTAHP